MISIRNYLEKDRYFVEKICIEQSAASKNKKLIKPILSVFCRYYIEQEACNCFVAADENDIAVGYILCAVDYVTWSYKFKTEYLKTDNRVTLEMGEYSVKCLEACANEYPAHLHIDISREYQGKGVGSELIGALKKHLANLNVNGLALAVDDINVRAQKFYLKNGFYVLGKYDAEILMGIKISR